MTGVIDVFFSRNVRSVVLDRLYYLSVIGKRDHVIICAVNVGQGYMDESEYKMAMRRVVTFVFMSAEQNTVRPLAQICSACLVSLLC